MFKPGDPIIKKHTVEMKQWRLAHPNDSWKTNLSHKEIQEMQEKYPGLRD